MFRRAGNYRVMRSAGGSLDHIGTAETPTRHDSSRRKRIARLERSQCPSWLCPCTRHSGCAVGPAWEDHGLVFATQLGTPLEPRNVNRRFSTARSAAGLPWVRLHDLRHAFATFLLDQGEELRTGMDLLGHSTIRLTADTYGHVLPSRARSAVDAIDRVLGGQTLWRRRESNSQPPPCKFGPVCSKVSV